MKKTRLVLPIIIIVFILLVGGIIGTIFYFTQQTALESARGQTIFEDFNSGVNPCINTMIQKINDFPEAKCIYANSCTTEICTPQIPTMIDGQLQLYTINGANSYLNLNLDLSNSDVSIYYTMQNGKDGGETRLILTPTPYPVSFMSVVPNNYGYDEISGLGAIKEGVIKIYKSFLGDGYIINVNGRETKSSAIPSFLTLNVVRSARGGGMVHIDEIRYSKPFSTCRIDDNSVLIFDDFAEGSTIRWIEPKTFTYAPLSFCYDVPAIKRSFVEGGLQQDKNVELTHLIAQGGEYVVKQGEMIRLLYITKKVGGMQAPCNYFSGYALNKDRKCVKLVEEEPIVLQCKINSDCPLPSACESEKDEISCMGGVCKGYESILCKNEVLVYQTIYKDIYNEIRTPIFVGVNEFTITKNEELIGIAQIGDKSITVNKPEFVCNVDNIMTEDEKIRTVRDRGCYRDNIGGLNECVELVNCESNNLGLSNWATICRFKVNNDCLKITETKEQQQEALLNSEAKMKLVINNKFGNFKDASGLINKCSKSGLQEDLGATVTISDFNFGDNDLIFKKDTKELGKYNCKLNLFADVKADGILRFASSNEILYNYNVVDKLTEFAEEKPIIKESVKSEIIEKTKQNYIIWAIGITLIVLVSVTAIIVYPNLAKKKKKRR